MDKKKGISTLSVLFIILVIIFALMDCGKDDKDWKDKCGACHGTGYYEHKTCPFCHGTGYSDYDPYEQLNN